MNPPPNMNPPLHPASSPPLLVDLYELTMLQAYWRAQMFDVAVFSLFARRLPAGRNYLMACGLEDALQYLENLRFDSRSLEFLRTRTEFSSGFLDWLADLRFTGDVYAVPEGTPIFANEPLLEVVAPMPEAQIIETILINQMHLQTLLATKAARVVFAAGPDRTVVDFGLRRMHGTDAGLKSVRAFFIAGVKATSNVLAGAVYGVPIAGTMAHSYIQAHDNELDAFRRYAELYPETTLLVDTYDTIEGVRKVVQLARELGSRCRLRAIRLDSGNLIQLAFEARRLLDANGLDQIQIFASGDLDEYAVSKIVESGAPIAAFGVGTNMGVSRDAPALDMVFKLTKYAGVGRVKIAPGKATYPGRKQIFRQEENNHYVRDILAGSDESLPGTPLLRQVMAAGKRLPAGCETLLAARDYARRELSKLPERLLSLMPAEPPYEVQVSAALQRRARQGLPPSPRLPQ
jgi:nicotinate phosphoribosyltransferase